MRCPGGFPTGPLWFAFLIPGTSQIVSRVAAGEPEPTPTVAPGPADGCLNIDCQTRWVLAIITRAVSCTRRIPEWYTLTTNARSTR